MDTKDLTAKKLQAIPFQPPAKPNQATIDGVRLQSLTVHLDGRGDLIELWSERWLPDGIVPVKHAYQSGTDAGVVKAWHLHAEHTDQFTVTRGKLQVTVADVREGSPTFGQVNTFFMGVEQPTLLQIPPGLLHGWKALSSPEVLVVNFQSHVYDPKDEFKFAWDCVLPDVWQPRNG